MFGAGLSLFVPITGATSGPRLAWPNGYRYRMRRILAAADHAMPDGAEAWIFWSVSDAAIKSVANGGHVEDGAFLDSRFENGFGARLRAEGESYDPVGGTITAWVRLTGFRAGADYAVVHSYGKAGLTEAEADPAGCWSGWPVSARLSDGLDQSGNGRHLTLTTVTPTTLLGAAAGDFA